VALTVNALTALLVVVVVAVTMPTMLNDHNFLVMSVPAAIVVAITLYDNRVLGSRRSVRKSDRYHTKSNNSQYKISHFVSSQVWMSSRQ
jgi:hypothetical protein